MSIVVSIKTEAESRGFNGRLPLFRVVKVNSTPTRLVTNLKHKEMFSGFLQQWLKAGWRCGEDHGEGSARAEPPQHRYYPSCPLVQYRY